MLAGDAWMLQKGRGTAAAAPRPHTHTTPALVCASCMLCSVAPQLSEKHSEEKNTILGAKYSLLSSDAS